MILRIDLREKKLFARKKKKRKRKQKKSINGIVAIVKNPKKHKNNDISSKFQIHSSIISSNNALTILTYIHYVFYYKLENEIVCESY